MTPLLLTFIINIATSVLKKKVLPNFGKLGAQIMVFAMALLVASYYSYKEFYPGLEIFVMQTVTLFAYAVALYEVFLSKLDIFKKIK